MLIINRFIIFVQVFGVWSTDFIPRGTRFGPLVGRVYARDSVPETASRKYFWRIYDRLGGGDPTVEQSNKACNEASSSVHGNQPTTATAASSVEVESCTVTTSENQDFHYIDGADPSCSNWMRYVNPAYSAGTQNLVACQVNGQIFFYTISSIHADQELLVWYSREFAARLNYPLTGAEMLAQIGKSFPASDSIKLARILTFPLFCRTSNKECKN